MSRTVKFFDAAQGKEVEVVLRADIARLIDQDVRLTDSDGVFFQRQLEAIESQTYDVLYPDLEARSCFKTNTFGGAGARILTYRSFDRVGKAQVINARATDLPKSDISGKEYSITVKSVGVAYDFDIDEIAAAQMAGMPLEARKTMAARRGYEEYINSVVWRGDEEAGLGGLFTNEEIQRTAVAAGTDGKTGWADKTPDEVIADLTSACGQMYALTKKIHSPKEIWMDTLSWNYIFSTPRSPMSDTTIGEYFCQNNQFGITKADIKPLNELAEGIPMGVGEGAKCFIVLNQTTPEGMETVRIRETLPLQFLPVQLHGLVYEVPGRGRFAGLEVTYPRAIDIWYGI
ncbi:major capsid protein [Aeromonas phage pAh6.2TG]|uniref:Major capsid protein n=1 Tax=Aeromonas phage pAh6.2TG TaxID=2849625 RepID=A0A8F3C999_9CAUD|nr:major capsid protein [Aeromonas phage pAh6.2TG]QWY14090.1 major capsid protein [Aeromonas phage pAh6.2TG]